MKIILILISIPFLLIALVIGTIAWSSHIAENVDFPNRVRALIPRKIETAAVTSNDYDFFNGPGGACEGLSFQLSKKTADEIKSHGLEYFNDMAFPEAERTYYGKADRWRAWRKAPVLPEDDKAYRPNGCGDRNFKKFLKDNGYRGTTDIEAYYTYVTDRGAASLWVYPQWGIIVYSYYS